MGKLGIGGIAAQIAALALLARAGNSTALLLTFLMMQGLAAAMKTLGYEPE